MGYLRVYLGNELKEQFDLHQRGHLTIGRAQDNDLVIPDPKVSAHHAVIRREGNHFFIEDLGSTNGVFLNNERIERAQLKYWDEIQIYTHILKFMALSAPQEGEAPKEPNSPRPEVIKTQAIELTEEQRLALLKQQQKVAYLILHRSGGRDQRIPFGDQIALTIGRSKSNDIRTGGWFFAPEIAARLERTKKGFYLVPKPRGEVMCNGKPVTKRIRIQDGDAIRVRRLSLHFYHRVEKD